MAFELTATVAERGVDLTLGVGDREVVAVLGSERRREVDRCCRVIAGLLRPDSGRRRLDGRVLFDVGRPGRRTVWVPAHARGVALLAQEPLLFPHLTALDNVAFGPRSVGRLPQRVPQPWPGGGSPRSTRASTPTANRPSSREARRNASRSPVPSPPTPTCCSSTSPWQPSTWPSHPPCARCCAGCWPTVRSSSSPTTSSTRCSWPTGSSSSRTGTWSRTDRPRRCWRDPAAASPRASPG